MFLRYDACKLVVRKRHQGHFEQFNRNGLKNQNQNYPWHLPQTLEGHITFEDF